MHSAAWHFGDPGAQEDKVQDTFKRSADQMRITISRQPESKSVSLPSKYDRGQVELKS